MGKKYVISGPDDSVDRWCRPEEYGSLVEVGREILEQYRRACAGEETELFNAGEDGTVLNHCRVGEKVPISDFKISGDYVFDIMMNERPDWSCAEETIEVAVDGDFDELGTMVSDAVNKWLEKNCPNLYVVTNITDVDIDTRSVTYDYRKVHVV